VSKTALFTDVTRRRLATGNRRFGESLSILSSRLKQSKKNYLSPFRHLPRSPSSEVITIKNRTNGVSALSVTRFDTHDNIIFDFSYLRTLSTVNFMYCVMRMRMNQ
jgi:hypothetical protein